MLGRSTLDALHHRITQVRSLVSPRTYADNPWIRLGAALVVGFELGRRAQASAAARAPGPPEKTLHLLVRTALLELAAAALRDVASHATER